MLCRFSSRCPKLRINFGAKVSQNEVNGLERRAKRLKKPNLLDKNMYRANFWETDSKEFLWPFF